MSIACIFDDDIKTDLFIDLQTRIQEIAQGKGWDLVEIGLRKSEIPPCTGCLLCVTKHPGTCVYGKTFDDIARKASGHPFVIFLTPSHFGTFSSTLKNIVDRGGLIIKNNSTCTQIVIGYAQDATNEEISTFIDIIAKHQGKADVVHPLFNETFEVFFTRSLEDNKIIEERVRAIL